MPGGAASGTGEGGASVQADADRQAEETANLTDQSVEHKE